MKHWLDAARAELAQRVIDQGVHYKVLFLGSSVNGTTDIVSCLSRSLRNLGHHVLDIDLKKHGHATDNPTGARAGYGPIFLRPDFIDPICERFRPQVIVCCAGGLTFHPAHAAQLKETGAILVGLTLSDPDVFPSVHAHVHVFDFHTTNAQHSLSEYKAAGVHNTVYFPFGIDRGFISQAAPPAPELAADVICMGHASGRPERNSLMSALAREFDVKTYGRGWVLPGSAPVQGERMIQAIRAGRIHINFPLTRAGFVNIKCGVFESVGSGGLVCTGRFSEMARFFDYDTEIIGYENEEDLARQLREVLASPERRAAMTEAAFRRLTSEHLYEHRWMALFKTMFNCSADDTPWLPEARIRQIRQVLAASQPRTKHVVLSGFYGASNLGDELILRSIQAGLARADASVQVTVASENPANVERDHGLQAFSRRALPQALQHARTASAILVGGGGLWHDYTFARSGGLLGLFQEPQMSMAGFAVLPTLGRMFDVPTHVVGMGVGPMTDPDAFRMLRFVAGLADTIYVRDEQSLALLHEARAGQNAFMAPDVVYALPLPQAEPPAELRRLREDGYTLLGLNLRPWAKGNEQELVSSVVEALRSLATRHKLAVVGIPMQAGSRHDEAVLKAVADALGPEVHFVSLKPPLSPGLLAGALAACSALLAMRLHACLVAHRLRVPVVGLAYDPKVSSHFLQVGRSAFCTPLEAGAAVLRDMLAAALAENGQVPAGTHETIGKLEAVAQEAMAVAARRIAETPAVARVFEVPASLATLRQTMAQLHVGAGRADAGLAFAGGSVGTTAIDSTLAGEAVRESDARIQIHLPVNRPLAGQDVRWSGNIEVPPDIAEIGLLLTTNYRRDNFEGRLLLRLQVGDRELTEDLAHERGTIQLRLGIPREQKAVPVQLNLQVLKNCFESSAWPVATRISLSFDPVAVRRGQRASDAYLLVSRGQLGRPAPAATLSAA